MNSPYFKWRWDPVRHVWLADHPLWAGQFALVRIRDQWFARDECDQTIAGPCSTPTAAAHAASNRIAIDLERIADSRDEEEPHRTQARRLRQQINHHTKHTLQKKVAMTNERPRNEQ